ncbi:MAG: amidohydrolase [Anaerostipes sp.]|jgi:predicted amidohydrolase YtcJ
MAVIYYNGSIITLEKNENVDAILEEDGKIQCVGTVEECKKAAKEQARFYDLDRKCLMPAFIDAHSHLSNLASNQLQISLTGCSARKEVEQRIKTFIHENGLEPGEWVQAYGYDHNLFDKENKITLSFLDGILPDYPLIISHASGHSCLLNTCGLKCLGITTESSPISGGVIGQKNGELTGYLEENACFEYLKKVPMADMKRFLQAYEKAQDIYASYGITTIQEGMCVTQMVPLLKALTEQNLLKLDLVGYVCPKDMPAYKELFPIGNQSYHNNFRVGGYKIFLDGSPQQRTAWMLTPYIDDETYYGYPVMSDEEVYQSVKQAYEEHVQILAHCNGDAASEQYLNQIGKFKNIKDIRPVIIHAQLLNVKQLDKVKENGMIPSYFIGHIYHWGDVHIKNFGRKRASKISPTKSTLEKGILFTFHQDTPVIQPDMLESIWCAVNRMTKKGVVLGKEEAIDVYDAIKAVTINAAYQYHEEKIKGSLKIGKQANFVILSQSPLACKPMDINNIKIEMTIKEGNIIYQR